MAEGTTGRARWRDLRESVFAQGLVAACGVASGVILARTLGPTMRGEVAAVVTWATVLSMGCDLSIGQAAAYLVSREPSRVASIWSQSLILAAAGGTAVALGASLVVPLVLKVQTTSVPTIVFGLCSVPFMIATTFQGYLLLGAGRIRQYNAIRVGTGAAYALGIGVVSWWGHRSVFPFVAVFTSAQALTAVVSGMVVRGALGAELRLVRPQRDLIAFGARTHIASASAQVSSRLDQLVLAVVLQPERLGHYAVSAAYASALGPIITGAATVTIAQVGRARTTAQGAREGMWAVRNAAALALPVAVGAALVAGWLIPFAFGKEFGPAVLPARILVVATSVQGIGAIAGHALRGLGRPSLPAIAESAGLAVAACTMFFAVPAIGIVGAAVGTLVGSVAVTAIAAPLLLLRPKRDSLDERQSESGNANPNHRGTTRASGASAPTHR